MAIQLTKCTFPAEFDILYEVKMVASNIGPMMDINVYNASMSQINKEFRWHIMKNAATKGSYLFTLSADKISLDKWVEDEFGVILDMYHPHLEYSVDSLVKIMEMELAMMTCKFGQLHEIQYLTAVYKMIVKYFNVSDIINIPGIPDQIFNLISEENIKRNADFLSILRLDYTILYKMLLYVKPEHIVEDILEKYSISREDLYKFLRLMPDDMRSIFGAVYPEISPVEHLFNPEVNPEFTTGQADDQTDINADITNMI